MDELTFDNEKFVSSKRAAQMTGYAKDYVGQLCREGRVKARLVGRNWYVLESSILEHRFGAEEQANEPVHAEKEPVVSWEAPKYIAEEPATIPELAPKPKMEQREPTPAAEAPDEAVSEAVEPSKDPVAEMQTAWKEWFDRQEKALPDASEMLLADHEEVSSSGDAEEPVVLHKSEEIYSDLQEEVAEEEPVHIARVRPAPAPIHRARPEETMDLRSSSHSFEEANEDASVRYLRPIYREERPRREKKPSNYAVRALFIAVAVVAVAVAVVGSGLLDQNLNGQPASAITDFLSGKQQVSR